MLVAFHTNALLTAIIVSIHKHCHSKGVCKKFTPEELYNAVNKDNLYCKSSPVINSARKTLPLSLYIWMNLIRMPTAQ